MRRIILSLVVLVGLLVLFGAVSRADLAIATRFDPVFRIVQIDKQCFILKPGESPSRDEKGNVIFPDARDRRAYPYGSRVMTIPGGGSTVKFSPASECVLGPGVTLVVGEDPKEPNIKVLKLEAGKIDVNLEKSIEVVTNSVMILTPSGAIVYATNFCSVAVQVSTTSDRAITKIMCNDGNIRVRHPDLFEVFLMSLEKGKEQGIEIVSSLDNNFIKVTDEKGTFGVKVRNPPDPEIDPNQPKDAIVDAQLEIFEGLPHEDGFKIWKVTPDTSVKFSQRKVDPGKILIVTILMATPDGAFQQEISYRYDTAKAQAVGVGEAQAPAQPAAAAAAGELGGLDALTAPKEGAKEAPKGEAGKAEAKAPAKADDKKPDAPKAKAKDDLLPIE